MRFDWGAYIRLLLTALSSLFGAVLLPTLVWLFRHVGNRATGIAAAAGGLIELAFSPGFWIAFIAFLSGFYITGKLERKSMRVVFFWIPSILICVLGFALWGMLLYAFAHGRNG